MIAVTPPKIFSKEVAQKQATPFPRQDLLTARNRFWPNFRGWGLDENLKPKSPPYRGATHKKLGDKGKMAVLAFSQARLRCDGPCQSRSRATWPPSRSKHPSQSTFAPCVRPRCLSSDGRALPAILSGPTCSGRQIIAESGSAGLFEALKRGVTLPAVAFAPLVE